MKIELLDSVVLTKDMPDQGLRSGDVGAVVEKYGSTGLEVEFVTGSGHTQALVTLSVDDVRDFGATDLLSARPSTRRSPCQPNKGLQRTSLRLAAEPCR